MNSLRTFLRIRKRVEQHVTKQSLILLVLIVGLFFEAYMHNFNLVYITLFFILAAAMGAIPLGILNIGHLEADFDGCGRLFANRPGACRFRVKNGSSSTSWGIDLCCRENRETLPPIPPHTEITASTEPLPPRRGRFPVGPCRLESRFPLATVRFAVPVKKSMEATVFPEPKGRPLESFLQQMRAPYGYESDFDGLAGYTGSESASRIHWPSVAKGATMVKHFETERESDTLRFDFQRCASHDEARLSQLTLWVLECERRSIPFVIQMPGRLLDSRKEGIDAILETLALY